MDGLQTNVPELNEPVTNAGDASNAEPEGISRRKVMAQVAKLGAAEGLGSNSRPGLYLVVCEGARSRVIKRDDIPEIVKAFSMAHAKARNLGYVPMTSEKQQESKLGTAVYLGELTHVNGLDVAQRAASILKEQREKGNAKDFLPPFDALVNVARVQLSQQDTALSDEQLAILIRKPEKDEAELEADRINKIAAAIDKMLGDENNPVSDETAALMEPMIATLMGRITELGGTSKQIREAQREADKAAKAKKQLSGFMAKYPNFKV